MYFDRNGQKAGELDDDATVAPSLHLDKGALYPIEGAANDADGGATLKVEFIGTEIEKAIIIAVADTYELSHLILGHEDGAVATIDRRDEVLHNGTQGLELAHDIGSDVHKQQVVNGGDQFARLTPLAVGDYLVTHGHEGFNAMLRKPITCLEFATVRSTQGIPYLRGLMENFCRQGVMKIYRLLLVYSPTRRSLGS